MKVRKVGGFDSGGEFLSFFWGGVLDFRVASLCFCF